MSLHPETARALVKAIKATGESSEELERAVEEILDGQAQQLAATKALEQRASAQSGEIRAIREGQDRIETALARLERRLTNNLR